MDRIVLADGFHEEAEMYAASLEHYGFEVTPIRTGDVSLALDVICRVQPDAVLTRILPGRFGIELVHRLRSDPSMGSRPVLILTSLAHSPLLQEARTCGATEILLLPVDVEEIARILRRHLRKQRSA